MNSPGGPRCSVNSLHKQDTAERRGLVPWFCMRLLLPSVWKWKQATLSASDRIKVKCVNKEFQGNKESANWWFTSVLTKCNPHAFSIDSLTVQCYWAYLPGEWSCCMAQVENEDIIRLCTEHALYTHDVTYLWCMCTSCSFAFIFKEIVFVSSTSWELMVSS